VVLVRKEDAAGNSKPAIPSGTSSSATPAGGTNFGAAKFIRGTLGNPRLFDQPRGHTHDYVRLSGPEDANRAQKPPGAYWRRPVSCSWTSQKVAVHYGEGDTGKASVISLEIQ